MEKKKKISWKNALQINVRAIRLYLDRYPGIIISSIVCVIWKAIIPYVNIYLSALVIDELMDAKNTQRMRFLILLTLLSAVVTSLVSVLLNKWKEVQQAGFWYKQEHIWSEKRMDMDYQKVDDAAINELLSTIKQNQSGGDWGLARVIGNCENLVYSVCTIVGGISLTVSLFASRVPEHMEKYVVRNNPIFIAVIVAVMLAVTFISPMLSNKADSYSALNAGTHNFANRLFSFFGWLGYRRNIAADVRLFRQDIMCGKYNTNKENTFCLKGFFAKLSWGPIGFYKAASAAVSVVFTGVVYAFVCIKAWAGAFGLGAVMQYISAITRVAEGVSTLFSTIGEMRNNASFVSLAFQFLDIPNDMYQGSLTVEKRNDRKYEVEFRNVSFKYPGSDTYALKNVNMKFEVGKRIAVVGMNGSGKTTFIKLLCRLYDPTEGEILLNGIDIRKYNYEEYMNIFSVVFQDFKLPALKLGENVASGASYDEARVNKCLTEAEIYFKFNDIVGDKTAVYISHRLSSCKFCDEILVFNAGEVVQQGTHEKLVADGNSKYYELWHAQAQYYTA